MSIKILKNAMNTLNNIFCKLKGFILQTFLMSNFNNIVNICNNNNSVTTGRYSQSTSLILN